MVAAPLGLAHLFGGGAVAAVDHVKEAVEQVAGIVRAGAGLRVVLNRENGLRGVPEAFQGLVVEVDVSGFAPGLLQGLGLDGKSVVLAGDLYPLGKEVLDGLVGSAVAEFELEGGGPEGQAQQLVP